MRKRRLLGSTTAIIVAATVLVQTTSVHAAEDFFTCDEIYENDSEVFSGYDDTQELVVEDDDRTFGDDEEDSGYEISEDEETEITDESEVVIDEGPSESDLWGDDFEDVEYAEDVEIVEDAIEFDSEDVSENDSSGNDSCEADISANDLTSEESGEDVVNVTAAGAHVSTVTIKCGIAKSSEKAEKYGIKFQKDDAVKSAVFTLGTDYTSMKLTAALKDKDGKELNYTPTWKSSNEKVIQISGSGSSVTIKAVGKGKGKVTCFAGDGSKKKSSVTFTVRQAVTDFDIVGQTYILPGAKAKYKTKVFPKNADKTTYTWSLKNEPDGVTINKKGQVSIRKDVKAGTFTIVAKSNDLKGVTREMKVVVREDKARKVTLTAPEDKVLATHAIGSLNSSARFSAETDNGETVSWKVSDETKASIKADGNKATVTALAPGKVKVTAYANDGSTKKATYVLKVIIPASGINLTVPADRQDDKLASGGSLQFKAVLGNAYGKPSGTKVRWEYEIVGYADKGQTKEKEISEEVQQKILKKKYLFTFSNGKVTAVSPKSYDKQALDLYFDCGCNNYGIRVTAYTTDGSDQKVTKLVKRANRNTYMRINRGNTYDVAAGHEYPYDIILLSENRQGKLYIDNKNEDIASVTVDSKDYIHIKGHKKGRTTVTIKAMDGSGLKVTITVNVR